MLNLERLSWLSGGLAVLGILWLRDAPTPAAQLPGAIFICMSVVLLCIRLVARPTKLDIRIRGMHDTTLRQWHIEKLLREDPEFYKAVEYAYKLDTDKFLQFGSLVAELRYDAGQSWLRKISRQFRKEREDGKRTE